MTGVNTYMDPVTPILLKYNLPRDKEFVCSMYLSCGWASDGVCNRGRLTASAKRGIMQLLETAKEDGQPLKCVAASLDEDP